MPTKATPPLPLAVSEPPETPFSKSKKSRRGKSQKNMQRVFLAGRSARLRALGGGAWIRLHARNGFAPDRKTPPS